MSSNNNSRKATAAAAARGRRGGRKAERSLTQYEEKLVEALGSRKYHLPGHGCFQDWCQYFRNNHPLFAPCCQHPLHPVGRCMSLVGLFGSVFFGLAITNVIWLLYIYNQEQDGPIYFSFSFGGVQLGKNGTEYSYLDQDHVVSRLTGVDVTPGMLVLWTIGAIAHAIFDNFIWYAASCICCKKIEWCQKHKGMGNVFVILLVVLITAISTMVAVVRTTLTEDTNVNVYELRSAGITDDAIDLEKIRSNKDAENYEFLMSYAVELVLAWFLFFPAIETISFSGVLGCNGRIPALSGRPYEVEQEEQERREARSGVSSSLRTASTTSSRRSGQY